MTIHGAAGNPLKFELAFLLTCMRHSQFVCLFVQMCLLFQSVVLAFWLSSLRQLAFVWFRMHHFIKLSFFGFLAITLAPQLASLCFFACAVCLSEALLAL